MQVGMYRGYNNTYTLLWQQADIFIGQNVSWQVDSLPEEMTRGRLRGGRGLIALKRLNGKGHRN